VKRDFKDTRQDVFSSAQAALAGARRPVPGIQTPNTFHTLSIHGPGVFHSFTGGADGGLPGTGSLTRDSGNIYGATPAGGADNGGGVLFRVDPTGSYTVLHTFVSAQDGLAPSGGLLLLGGGRQAGQASPAIG
jgi:uncharacterized repeat protein (TIGR03803 family)